MKQTNFIEKAGKACSCKMLIAVFMLTTLACSCEEDYEANITYKFVCSSDMLEFVTPEVTHTNTHGDQEKIVITDGMWNKSNVSISEAGGVSISQTIQGYSWVKFVKYDSWGIEDKIEINYIKKDSTTIDDSRVYCFCHSIDANVVATRDKYKNKNKNIHIDNTFIVGKVLDGSNIEAINAYIDSITQTTDTKYVKVDGNGGIVVQ